MKFLALFSVLLGSVVGSLSFTDLWLTGDQQGRRAFERGDFSAAAERFEDPMWKGSACYRAEDWDCAVDQFARLDTAEAYFDLANTYARKADYELAIEAYDRALERRPEWPEAVDNRALVAALIAAPEEAEEEGEEGPPADPNLAPDEVQFDDKGKDGKRGEVDQALLSDEQIAEMWLRGVQTTPADFLFRRFAFEVADRRTADEEGGS